jgi:hypothetical protein
MDQGDARQQETHADCGLLVSRKRIQGIESFDGVTIRKQGVSQLADNIRIVRIRGQKAAQARYARLGVLHDDIVSRNALS